MIWTESINPNTRVSKQKSFDGESMAIHFFSFPYSLSLEQEKDSYHAALDPVFHLYIRLFN